MLCRQDIEAVSRLAQLFGSLLQEVGPEYQAAHPARVLRQLGAPELATRLSPGALRQLGQLQLSSRQTIDALAGTRLASVLQPHWQSDMKQLLFEWACWRLATLKRHHYLQVGYPCWLSCHVLGAAGLCLLQCARWCVTSMLEHHLFRQCSLSSHVLNACADCRRALPPPCQGIACCSRAC